MKTSTARVWGIAVGLLAAGLLTAGLVALPAYASDKTKEKQPEPTAKLTLDKLGFPGMSAGFQAVGASMLTVHVLDDSHLLVTYGLRGLVPRVENDPVDHDDREVAAEVVDVPSGKIEAKTQWHMHDHARYLWSLGQGRFLLRIGTALSTFAPMANLASGEAFRRVSFPYRPLHPTAIFVSHDGAMLTIEAERVIETTGAKVATWGDLEKSQQTATLIDLLRITGDGSVDAPVKVTAAKTLKSPRPLLLAIDSDGYLWENEDDRDITKWSLTFDGFGGKTMDLGPTKSSCEPRVQLLSKSEYLLVTCVGSDDQVKLAAYGFDGHENWEEPFSGFNAPAFLYAPEAGRFAMSRTVAGVQALDRDGGSSPERQELRVYQTESGDLLLKVQCSPVMKTAENFDMSADGRTVAVIRDGAIWVYTLPAPSARDKKDLEEVAKFAPPPAGDAPVSLTRIVVPVTQPGEIAPGNAVVAAPVQTPVGGVTSVAGGTVGDAPPDAVRKPPSLLNPGEKPEFKDKSAPPQ